MNISIITVSYNAAPTIRQTIESVLGQDYPHIEYIVVDGNSTDGTQDLVRSYGSRIATFVSEPDKGLYDAMNKGLALASGDVVGILNADDLYAHSRVISNVMATFADTGADGLFADLVYFTSEQPDKITRFYPGKGFEPGKMLSGNMPPHPTFFVKRSFYKAHGGFDNSYRICADFELMVRFFHRAKGTFAYLPEVIVRMRSGGSSTRGLSSTFTINREMLRACRSNGLNTSLPRIYSKYFTKIFQLLRRPS